MDDDQYRTSANLEARIALHRKYTPPGADMLDVVWANYPFEEGQKVLEVGCGSGTFWQHPAARDVQLDLVLTDASPGMLDSARGNLAQSTFDPQFAIADAQTLPFAEGEFDVVLSQFMLYHVPDKRAALREMARVAADWVGIVLVGKGSTGSIFAALSEIDPGLEKTPSDAELFTDVDAAPLIDATFADVDTYPYEFEMRATDADDVVRFAQSTGRIRSALPDFWEKYRELVAGEIETRGYFAVTKSCRLFICRAN